MNGFARAALWTFGIFFFLSSADSFSGLRGPSNGPITNLVFSFLFGSAPGLDQFDASGNYVLGSGNDGIHLPGEAVVVSFDAGHFVQAIPSGSFTAISGGWRYTAPSGASGITLMKVMNNGTFQIQARKLDLSATHPGAMGVLSFSVGDDTFSVIPNSPPVAKITGPATALVGSTVTLDGTQSSDFNSEEVTLAWSLVSQPQGSGVSLSSRGNFTTTFTPTHNGAYVVKAVPTDGIAPGIPAIFTVMVSGAGDPPPLPPGPDNGLISLSTNQASYLVGDSAVLNLHEAAQPGNGTSRWYFAATLNDQPITLTPVPHSNDNTYDTPVFTEAGERVFKVDLYLENTNLAKALAATIAEFNQDIVAVNKALQFETDPAIIAQLQAQKAYDLEQIASAQAQLLENRTKVGETAVLTFQVLEEIK